MSGAMDLLKGNGGDGGDKSGGGNPAPNEGTIDLLKGKSAAPVGDDPKPDPPKGDDDNPVLKELTELRKLVGRQGQELGELRKQRDAKPAAPAPAELPDPPAPSDFENTAEWQKAMKAWTKDVAAANTKADAQDKMVAEFEKQRIAAGIGDEEWDDVLETLNDPRHQNPATMRALAQFLKDPTKVTREAAIKIQELTSRTGTPGSSGTSTGKSEPGGDMSSDEAKSFREVMQTPIGRRAKAQEAHMARFKRFVKPGR